MAFPANNKLHKTHNVYRRKKDRNPIVVIKFLRENEINFQKKKRKKERAF